mmetsp:Transcript_10991/g.24216  ORF Transcript_10991/g.24216 Transcript_10991/m.24216 type:complete len:486 (-) Transcript_10991:191-1648(-)
MERAKMAVGEETESKDPEAENLPILTRKDSSNYRTVENSSFSDGISTESFLFENSNQSHSLESKNELATNKSLSCLEFPMVRIYLYRALFLHYVVAVFIGCVWLAPDIVCRTLKNFGIEEEVALMTQGYLKIYTMGYWVYTSNWTATVWFQAVGMSDVPAFISFFAAVIHWPVNLCFIYGLDMGYIGAAYATVFSQIIQLLLFCIYIFGTQPGRDRISKVIGRAKTNKVSSSWKYATDAIFSCSGIIQYLQLALPGILMISEWWASEFVTCLAGRLRPANMSSFAIGGMSIYQTINSFFFMFPVGISIAGSTRVGNLLGSGDPQGAQVASNCAVVSAGILCSIIAIMLFITPHTLLPSFFSTDAKIVEQATKTIPLLCIYLIFDGIQSALSGIIKGCGRQCIATPIVILSYWLIAVPFSWWLAFEKHSAIMCETDLTCGIGGLVTGLTLGTTIHCILLFIIVGIGTDWNLEAQKAYSRIAYENSN